MKKQKLEDSEKVDNLKSKNILEQTYWDSPEAHFLFGQREGGNVKQDQTGEALENVMRSRINMFKRAYLTPLGWKAMVNDFDQMDKCSSVDIFIFQSKAKYLALALQFALDHMPTLTWQQCCERSIKMVNDFENYASIKEEDEDKANKLLTNSSFITNWKTITVWFRVFRLNDDSFPNPHFLRNNKMNLPPLLHKYPLLVEKIKEHADKELNQMSGEMMHAFLIDTALPAIVEMENKDKGAADRITVQELLEDNGLKRISLPTIYSWMDTLGYKYCERKKCYYVDGHETPENQKYRLQFFKRYFSYERRAHQWIHLTVEERERT